MPIPTLVAKSIALKIGVGAATLSLGGVAFAAGTGSLPDAAQDVAHEMLSSIGVPASDHAADAAQNAGANGEGPDATGPAAVGLCRAFAAGEKAEHGEALNSVAFQALARAAGGQDNIEGYCEGVLADAGSEPAGPPADLPTGQPTDTPDVPDVPADPGAPDTTPSSTSHPTGAPTDLPTERS